ncbi:MAG: hypothetical protein KatS3mg030_715 [Saprospiraceae bacterium]|nr:MAG: hypothetical protein KatS3mg030_715 [Saprospiraceae bacterium]
MLKETGLTHLYTTPADSARKMAASSNMDDFRSRRSLRTAMPPRIRLLSIQRVGSFLTFD